MPAARFVSGAGEMLTFGQRLKRSLDGAVPERLERGSGDTRPRIFLKKVFSGRNIWADWRIYTLVRNCALAGLDWCRQARRLPLAKSGVVFDNLSENLHP